MGAEVVVGHQGLQDQEVPLKVEVPVAPTAVEAVEVHEVVMLRAAQKVSELFVLFGLVVQERFHQLAQETNNEAYVY